MGQSGTKEILPPKINSGDFNAVKQILDDSTIDALTEDAELPGNYRHSNIKMTLMFIACAFASVAQFAPIQFPEDRSTIGIFVVLYFIMNFILTVYIMWVEKNVIMMTHASLVDDLPALTIRSDFPRFKETYTLTVEETSNNNKEEGQTQLECYVGNYFTEDGYFNEDGFKQDVVDFVKGFGSKKKN